MLAHSPSPMPIAALVVVSKAAEAIHSCSLQQFSDRPHVIGDSGLHRPSDAERLVDAAEVEKGHVHMNSGIQMFERFAETKTQPGKAAKVCSHAQIGAFNMASRHASGMRVANDGRRDRSRDLGRRVPPWPLAVRRSIHFHQLREINIRTKVFLYRRNVGF